MCVCAFFSLSILFCFYFHFFAARLHILHRETQKFIPFVNKNKTDFRKGGIFAFRTESGLFIKRFQKRMDDKVDIISDNQVYSTQTLHISEIDIIGKVVSKFGTVN